MSVTSGTIGSANIPSASPMRLSSDEKKCDFSEMVIGFTFPITTLHMN